MATKVGHPDVCYLPDLVGRHFYEKKEWLKNMCIEKKKEETLMNRIKEYTKTEQTNEEQTGVNAAMAIGMYAMLLLLIIVGAVRGESVAGFMAVYFMGVSAQEAYDFFRKRTWQSFLPAIWWAGMTVAAVALRFQSEAMLQSEYFLMFITFCSNFLSSRIEGVKKKDWPNGFSKYSDYIGSVVGIPILLFSIYAFIVSL